VSDDCARGCNGSDGLGHTNWCWQPRYDALLEQLAAAQAEVKELWGQRDAAVGALNEAAVEYDALAGDYHRYGADSSRKNHRAPWEDCTDDTCVEHRKFVAKLFAVAFRAALAARTAQQPAEPSGAPTGGEGG
jgi:hypothetical protein